MTSLVNSHTNATRIGWHLCEIDLRFVPGLPPGCHTWIEALEVKVVALVSFSSRRFLRSSLSSANQENQSTLCISQLVIREAVFLWDS